MANTVIMTGNKVKNHPGLKTFGHLFVGKLLGKDVYVFRSNSRKSAIKYVGIAYRDGKVIQVGFDQDSPVLCEVN